MEHLNQTSGTAVSINEGKTTAIIAYLTVIGLVVAFVMNAEKKNSFARYHIVQSIGLMCCGFGLGLISWVPFLGWLAAIAGCILMLVLWITGLMNAAAGREKPVPVLGSFFVKWFASV